jgi:hypothetical protein
LHSPPSFTGTVWFLELSSKPTTNERHLRVLRG